MRRLVIAVASAFALGGCVAGMAANAVGMAAAGLRGEPQSNQHFQGTARTACSAQAAPYGTVHVIDVEQRNASRIIVWGTVDDGRQRQSFECGFTTQISYFKLRQIGR